MQLRFFGAARFADFGDGLTALDGLTARDQYFPIMGVSGDPTVGMFDQQQIPETL